MAGYWKIEKEWVHDWHLSGFECILLADIMAWSAPCTWDERAERVGISKNGVRKAFEGLLAKVPQSGTLEVIQNSALKCHKVAPMVPQSSTLGCHKVAFKVPQSSTSPHTPLNKEEENEEIKKSVDEARALAREEELAKMGVIGEVENLAEELKKEIQNGGIVSESAMRLYGIGQQELAQYVDWFVDKLHIDGTGYKSRADFRRHFNSWLRIQAEQRMKQQNNNNEKQNGPTDEFILRTAQQVAANGGVAF